MSGERFDRRAPAKINLALHVTGRRADGYHLLDSIVLPLSIADEVTLAISQPTERPGVGCRCLDHPELDGEANLAARAATAYLQRAGIDDAAVAITIRKRAWIAAGLGGGSSDAAAALLALQNRFGRLDAEALSALALQLGADVPFFIQPRPARARGVGEQIEPLNAALPHLGLLLLNPDRPLSTAAVFAKLAQQPGHETSSGVNPALLQRLSTEPSPDAVCALIHNDLRAAAASLCPQVEAMISLLHDLGARGAGLSGSGPTAFGIFDSYELAAAAQARIPAGPTRLLTAVATVSRGG